MYPFLSEETLRNRALDLRDSYANKEKLFPKGLNEKPQEILSGRNFIVCGSVCRSEIRVLAQHANVIAIVDDYLCKSKSTLFGIPVITSDAWIELSKKDQHSVSCVFAPGARAFQHFTKLATQWNIPTLLPLQFLHLLEACNVNHKGETGRFFWYGYEFFLSTVDNLDRLLEISRLLGDSYSKLSWLCVLLYRMTLNPFYLEGCAVGHANDNFNLNSYSTNREFFSFSENEVYVDGGAFTGDTIELFLKATNGNFRHIHSFEPSQANNATIRKRLNQLQAEYLKPLAESITLHEKGLWDADTVLRFNPSQTVNNFDGLALTQTQSAHLVDSAITSHIYDEIIEKSVSFDVPVTTIDDAANCEATFIKLEIEGSELKALHGAIKTIDRNRPQMAISIYHKPEDLITLTSFVLETGQNYKLGFRQHNFLCPDAMVLYCS